MGRPRTGSASRRDGRWVARVTLHREPHAPGTRAPRAEVAVTRGDGKAITEARGEGGWLAPSVTEDSPQK